MEKNTVLEQLKSNNNILSLPQVLAEILEVVKKDDFNSDDLCDIILKDPALTARILKMSNSSFYNRYAAIKNVHQAVSLMGVNSVKCLALSTSVFKPGIISKDTGIDSKELFNYILTIATTAQRIAQEVSYPSVEEAFIAGLLHDIGFLFFIQQYPSSYKQLLNSSDKNRRLTDAEIENFGISHTDVGKHLAKSWHLPDDIVQAVADHHNLSKIEKDKTLSNILKLSVAMTPDRFSGYDTAAIDKINQVSNLAKMLELSQSQLDEIHSLVIKDSFEIAEYLEIDIGSYEDMLFKANQEIWKSYSMIEKLFRERQELSKTLLEEEHKRGATESKNIAMATLSHYINNAVMAIYGRTQLLQLDHNKGNHDKIIEQLPDNIAKINNSVQKIVAVLDEMKKVSPIDQEKFDSFSITMNIDDLIEKRLKEKDFKISKEENVPI